MVEVIEELVGATYGRRLVGTLSLILLQQKTQVVLTYKIPQTYTVLLLQCHRYL